MKLLPDIERGKKIIEYRSKNLSWAEIGRLLKMDRNNARRTYQRVVRLSTDIKKANKIRV